MYSKKPLSFVKRKSDFDKKITKLRIKKILLDIILKDVFAIYIKFFCIFLHLCLYIHIYASI